VGTPPICRPQAFHVAQNDALQISALDLFVHIPVSQHRQTHIGDAGRPHRIERTGRKGATRADPMNLAVSRKGPGVQRMKLDAGMAHEVMRCGGRAEASDVVGRRAQDERIAGHFG